MTAQPTLRSLLRNPELRLTLATAEEDLPAGALDRPLRWVHSSDLSDPTPFLAEDLALLTTGTQFAQRGPARQFEYVARLAGRGVVGLGFGRDVALPEIPAPLRQACADAGMPLFEVPYGTPFIAIARAHAESIATPEHELRAQRRRLHGQLLSSLLHEESQLVVQVLGALPPEPVVVAVAEEAPPAELVDDTRPEELFAGESDAGFTLCLSAAREGIVDDLAARSGIRFGISSPASYASFSRAHAEARAALGHGGTGAIRFSAAAELTQMLSSEQAQRAASALLAPLRGTDLDHTLRIWLASDGLLDPAAAALGIHRHTLRTRIARAAALLDRDLSTFPARAEVWAALQAAPPR